MQLEPGQLLEGKYRLIRLLGQGGMGSVWHAHHLTLDAPVALKFIESGRLDEAGQQRFLTEARLAAALRSPHVVQILEYGVGQGSPYFAMELLEGETLAARLERVGRLDVAETTRVVQHVCRAIARAHDADVIHRDLKPANIFIVRNDDDEVIKVLDFGIAKHIGQAAAGSIGVATRSGVLLGTPRYMSPEQLDGVPVDFRTDIWALGVLAYVCLVGEQPFGGENMSSLLLAICSRPLPVPSERGPVPDGFDAWFARACARDREARFSSARAAAAEFAALSDRSATGQPRPPPTPAPSTPQSLLATQPDPLGRTTAAATDAAVSAAARRRPRRWRHLPPLLVAAGLVGLAAFFGLSRRGVTTEALHALAPSSPPLAAPPPQPDSAPPGPAVARRRSIAVIGLRNTLGRSADAWLGAALADLLRTELESGDQLRTLSRERVATMKRDLELAESDSLERALLTRIQTMVDADLTLVGAYWRLEESDELRIDLTLQDARSGETVASVAEHGSASGLFEVVGRAGQRLRAKLGAEALSAEQLDRVKSTLPKDPQARVWFAEGRAQLDREEYRIAQQLLAKVVAIEPDFPLSHALLSLAWTGMFNNKESAAAAERARALSAGLPRQEQLLTEALAYRRNNQVPKAVEILRSLFTVFPDNADYGITLMRMQIRLNQGSDAEATLEELRRLERSSLEDPRIDVVEAHLAGVLGQPSREVAAAQRAYQKGKQLGMRSLLAMARDDEGDGLFHLGRVDEARDALLDGRQIRASLGDIGGQANTLLILGQQLAQSGGNGPELARQYLAEALRLQNELGSREGAGLAHLGLGLSWWLSGQLRKAEAEYRLAIDELIAGGGGLRPIAASRANICEIQTRLGERAAATEICSSALDLDRQLGNRNLEGSTLAHLGNLSLLAGRIDEARERYESSLRLRLEAKDPGAIADSRVGLAELSRVSGDLQGARAQLEQALPAFRTGTKPDVLEDCQLVQMAVELDAGDAERVLSLREEWAARFGSPYRISGQVRAHSRFALALLAQGKLAEAKVEADQAQQLLDSVDEPQARVEGLLAAARVRAAAGDRAGAVDLLRPALESAQRAGRPAEYEVELALAELGNPAGSGDAVARLAELARRAQQEKLTLYAERARSIRQ